MRGGKQVGKLRIPLPAQPLACPGECSADSCWVSTRVLQSDWNRAAEDSIDVEFGASTAGDFQPQPAAGVNWCNSTAARLCAQQLSI